MLLVAGFPLFCSGAFIFKEADRWNHCLSIHLQKGNHKKSAHWRVAEFKGITSSPRRCSLRFQFHLLYEASKKKQINKILLSFSFYSKPLSLAFMDTSFQLFCVILEFKTHIGLLDNNTYFWILSMKECPFLVNWQQKDAARNWWGQHLIMFWGKSTFQDHVLGWTCPPWQGCTLEKTIIFYM